LKTLWKVLIGIAAIAVVLLALNAVALDNETKSAEVTIEGGEIVDLPGGAVQVLDQGNEADRPPIVLIHCYACSLHWWDRMAPVLARNHRVIRIDLLGHGGSEKPSSGYEIPQQAALVAGAMSRLGVEGAVVVGHSMGASVATALAEQSSELVDRLVVIDEAPDTSYGGLDLLARLQYLPVIGEAFFRFGRNGPWSEAMIERGYAQAFAPDYDLAEGFPNPDQVVDDYEAMTYSSFDGAQGANHDFLDQRPLTERLASAQVPALVIFGLSDQVYDSPEDAVTAYRQVQGALVAELPDAGHSPNVERPKETAALVREFAANASDAEGGAPPRDRPKRRGRR
jgi:pimeloyl-ACP methyl ester carboxylesterase